jgi:hypothetical protein
MQKLVKQSMDDLNQYERRELIGKFYLKNQSRGKTFTVRHFKKLKVSERTVYNIISKVEKDISLIRKSGSGRNPKILGSNDRKRLRNLVSGKVGNSYRSLGKKLKCDPKTVKKNLEIMGIKRFKRKSAPKVTEKQKLEQRRRLNKLIKSHMKPSKGLEVIMNDESYFELDGANYHENSYYYAEDGQEVPENIKFKSKAKYPIKVMVWLAISAKGRSNALFMKSRGNVNAKVYKTECITKRLMPFIRKFHRDQNFIFWPDLASSHYARETIEVYNKLNVRYVPRNENPPSVPQLRPIVEFWAEIKRRVYANGWTAITVEQLIRRINLKLKTFDQSYFQRLFVGLKTKIRKAAENGVNSVLR